MKKSILISLLVLSLAALLVVGGTMAWFTDDAEVKNEFTAGTVIVGIDEEFESDDNWAPGDVTDKDVNIVYTGSKDAYVRVSITPEWEDNLSIDNVELIFASDFSTYWVQSGDWYYYKGVVVTDQVLDSFLEQVKFVPNGVAGIDDNDYQGKALTITVHTEAVQASHDAYKDAWGLSALPNGVEL